MRILRRVVFEEPRRYQRLHARQYAGWPETFGVAKALCEDFNALAAARQDVVEAREQRDFQSLAPLAP